MEKLHLPSVLIVLEFSNIGNLYFKESLMTGVAHLHYFMFRLEQANDTL